MFKNSNILITGGTGSFGTTLIKKLVKGSLFKKIIVFSRDEKKQYDLRNKYLNENIEFIIGDVRDKESLRSSINQIDYIFHAAALKHVPSCEFFPLEAIKTNILGTQNVLDVAEEKEVKKVIVLSTDKAVFPINAMGMTKALMEKLMLSKSRNKVGNTSYCGVRYGNVMYSRGSVLPLFIKQIFAGEDITITHRDMSRFLLTLNDAIDLVLFAIKNGENGDIYVRKAPAAKIIDIAESLMKILQKKVKITEIGIRNGEKLHETMLSYDELFKSEELDDFFKISDQKKLDYEKYFSEGEKSNELKDYDSLNTHQLVGEELEKMLKRVPEIKNLI